MGNRYGCHCGEGCHHCREESAVQHEEEAWTEHMGPNGSRYYFNRITQKSTWQRPAAFSVGEQKDMIPTVTAKYERKHHDGEDQRRDEGGHHHHRAKLMRLIAKHNRG